MKKILIISLVLLIIFLTAGLVSAGRRYGTATARYRWLPPCFYYYYYYPHRYPPDDYACWKHQGHPYLRYYRPYLRVWVPGNWVDCWTPHGWKKIWVPGYWRGGWWWGYDDP